LCKFHYGDKSEAGYCVEQNVYNSMISFIGQYSAIHLIFDHDGVHCISVVATPSQHVVSNADVALAGEYRVQFLQAMVLNQNRDEERQVQTLCEM
jgi:hypothetical protein